MTSEGLDNGAVDVSARQAYELLARQPNSQLVDVRTRAEWSFVGVPDLSGLGKHALLVEWQIYPDMMVAPGFVDHLVAQLEKTAAKKDTTLLFLCRSGARSLAAAGAMAATGWTRCLNIAGGFEGPLDAARHRGCLDGWKAQGLPWVQS